MSETIKSHIYEQGLRGSDDVQACLNRDEIDIVLHGGDGDNTASLDYGAALRLGEWLITQAIAHGAGPVAWTRRE
ncbi:hypothetical protein LPC10_01600 [Methylorubrum sp. B1-46]|uniref:hypothetical protein n=1 Tax=Methylorubrum sp. B1-46 TaxID=2897334 RepID=UPI001E621892|nr:hypothetical protein [Methylorubrum sp. B1-46]UGB26335.1 hypothetical protein LPC10_01600 [Methylorubrum sp. B1-46]